MKPFVASLLLAAVCVNLSCAADTAREPQAVKAELALTMEKWPVPAMGVLALNDGPGAPIVAGVRAIDAPEPVQPGDVWHIGSNAKAMTATMIARLVERGLLSWTAPLEDMLPELRDEMRPEYRRVTLGDLMSHRAGFSRNSAAGVAAIPDEDPRPLPEQRFAYIKLALGEEPVGPVASGSGAYSNTGFVVAGGIAERITGESYEDLMRAEVFEPLGMMSAGFGGTLEGQPLGHLNGAPQTGAEGDNPALLAPAGGMHMSLADWAKFAQDQMDGERGNGKLLSADSYRYLHAPQGDSQNGLGWGLEDAPGSEKRRMWSHEGSNGRWKALIVLFPDENRGALVAANAAGENADKAVNRMAVWTLGLAD